MPPTFGGGPKCGRCGKAVFMAEQILGAGQTWHKLCFTCESCNKLLDSTTVADRDGHIFCKGCYAKGFGPKGYGYGGGAGALQHTGQDLLGKTGPPAAAASGSSSSGGGSPSTTRSGPSVKAAAASASAGSSGGGSFGGAEKCQVCSKSVYAAERVLAAGGVFHKTCFRCTSCRKGLDQGSVDQHEGQIYCPACHKREFGPKGFRGGTGGAMQDTQ